MPPQSCHPHPARPAAHRCATPPDRSECGRVARPHPSSASGSDSHSRVDPSISASSSVTVPVGSSLTPRSLQFNVSARGSGPLMLASMRSPETANIRGTTETSSPTHGGQAIGYSRLEFPSQRRKPDDGALDLRRFPAIRTARPIWAGTTRRAIVTCGVQSSGIALGIGPGCRCGRHSLWTCACISSSVRRRHHQTREHGLGATEEQRRPDSARHWEPVRQRGQQRVHLGSIRSATVSVACGRLAGA